MISTEICSGSKPNQTAACCNAIRTADSTEVAIDSGPTRDLYVVLAGLDESGTARLSVFVNPMVSWLWAAGIIMFAGGLFAVWPAAVTSRAPAS